MDLVVLHLPDGTEATMRTVRGEQEILIGGGTARGEALLTLLLGEPPERAGAQAQFVVPYTAEVDRWMEHLISVLITLRWSSPSRHLRVGAGSEVVVE